MSEVTRRHGVREVPREAQIRLSQAGGLLYVVTGAAGLASTAAAEDSLAHPAALVVVSVVAAVVGLVVLAIGRWMTAERVHRLFPWLVIVLVTLSGMMVSAGLFCAGTAFTVGAVAYMVAPIFGVYLFSRRGAGVLVAFVGAQYATVLAFQEGIVGPGAQWGFVMALVATTGVLVGTFIERADQLAVSEAQARAALARANSTLEHRVESQVDELYRLGRLRRFLSPQVAEAIMNSGGEHFLAPHRREVAVLFSDLRGFTRFSGRAEPEEILDVLTDYYQAVGGVVRDFDATLGHFDGDGIMAYFNDPVPCEEPALRAVEMAVALLSPMDDLCGQWDERGYELGYGTGIAFGHATLGVIGFEGRSDYTPLGTVVNLGSRLCDEATNRQVLIDLRVKRAVDDRFDSEHVGDLVLKGFEAPVPAYEVRLPR